MVGGRGPGRPGPALVVRETRLWKMNSPGLKGERAMRPRSWLIMIVLLVISACGESEPQFVGTAHVLRVLEGIETQQAEAVERLAALEASVGEAVSSPMSDASSPEEVTEPARAALIVQ